ncbi:MAG: PHP domain-containing protein [Rhabdochlamydiaceae bacterium]
MAFKADLHTHTFYSDGKLSPSDLIARALQKGLQAICMTDHDTIEGYRHLPSITDSFFLGTGVEFSAFFRNKSVHILGYDIDLLDDQLLSFCLRHKKRRDDRNREIVQKLNSLGFFLDMNDLEANHMPGRLHIAEAMVRKGYVQTTKQAFDQYIGNDKLCYAKGPLFEAEETISVIKKAGGKAFLAHPYCYEGKNWLKRLLELPFDGIECYYGNMLPAKEKKWLDLAKDRNMLISGGSDFHDPNYSYIDLGSSWVSEELFFNIFEKNVIRFS